MKNKKSLHYAVHSFVVEPGNMDFIKATAHRLRKRGLGTYLASRVVNNSLGMIREDAGLTDRLTDRIERKKKEKCQLKTQRKERSILGLTSKRNLIHTSHSRLRDQ
jgi:hypothetical protein